MSEPKRTEAASGAVQTVVAPVGIVARIRRRLAELLHPSKEDVLAGMRQAVGRLEAAGERAEQTANKLDPLGDLIEGLRGEHSAQRKRKKRKAAR